ncbi:hypothetical protein ACTFIU_001610 [Dictyostelium citrinum]
MGGTPKKEIPYTLQEELKQVEKYYTLNSSSNTTTAWPGYQTKKPLLDQDLKLSYYDFLVMHVVKKLKATINEIHNILTPNGQSFSPSWPSSDSDIESTTNFLVVE